MRARDLFAFAWRALVGHRLRSALSLVGTTIGVAAVVVLTGLGEGARRYVVGQFADIGSNLVIVVPGRNETTGVMPGLVGVANDLTLDDARAIARRVRGVVRVAPIAVATETVAHGSRRRQVAVIGTSREYFLIRNLPMASGEPLPALELERGAPLVVLGAETARELFGGREPVGEVVRVGGWRMRVVGVMEAKGVQIGVDLDDLALVPVATAMRMFDRASLFRVLVETPGPAHLGAVGDGIRRLLVERHGEDDVTILTQEEVVSTLSTILGTLTVTLAAIGAVSLAVAGIGIMNVMLVSVAERTAEVGLLRAVGAARRQVLAVFLAEAAIVSTAGGLLGLALGLLLVRGMRVVWPALPAAAPGWALAAAMAVAVTAGVAFGSLPARRAAALAPVTALGRG